MCNTPLHDQGTAVPQRVTARTQYATLSPRKGKTQTIVDEKGHLLPGKAIGVVNGINLAICIGISPCSACCRLTC
jgi:hypothetical protein